MTSLNTNESVLKILHRFYQDTNFNADSMTLVEKHNDHYAHQVSPIPAYHRRIDDNKTIEISSRT